MSSASDFLSVSPVGKFNIKKVSFKGKEDDYMIDNKSSNDEGMKTSAKLMLGASALASVTAAAVMLPKFRSLPKFNMLKFSFVEAYRTEAYSGYSKTKFSEVDKIINKVEGMKNKTVRKISHSAVDEYLSTVDWDAAPVARSSITKEDRTNASKVILDIVEKQAKNFLII